LICAFGSDVVENAGALRLTVIDADPGIVLNVAVGLAGPAEAPAVNRPEELTVPQPAPTVHVHVARLVRSVVVDPPTVVHVPMASNCCVCEADRTMFVGVTVIDTSVAGVRQTFD